MYIVKTNFEYRNGKSKLRWIIVKQKQSKKNNNNKKEEKKQVVFLEHILKIIIKLNYRCILLQLILSREMVKARWMIVKNQQQQKEEGKYKKTSCCFWLVFSFLIVGKRGENVQEAGCFLYIVEKKFRGWIFVVVVVVDRLCIVTNS